MHSPSQSQEGTGACRHRWSRPAVHRGLALAGLLVAMADAPVRARDGLELVSPGGAGEPLLVASSCPTFSWAGGDGLSGAGYQVAVLRVESAGSDEVSIGDAVIVERVPADARSWTPPGVQCLEPGVLYAWSVLPLRAADGADLARRFSGREWADPLFFEVPGRPTETEIREALAVLRAAASSEVADPGGRTPADRGLEKPRARRRPGEGVAGKGLRVAQALAVPDRIGLRAELPATREIGFGVMGATASDGAGSAGLVGEATATSGAVYGVVGVTRSRQGAAGLFENSSGGSILSGIGPTGEVFSVDRSGAVAAASFAGNGAGLVDLQWGSIDNVPSGFDDGVDDDTVYQAGPGLSLDGSTLRVTSLPVGLYVGRQKVATASAAEDPSIVIGADGLPVISYYDSGPGELRVVHCQDTVCSQASSRTVDDNGIVGKHNDMVIGRDGYPLISYYGESITQLKLARCFDVRCASFSITGVDVNGDVGEYSAITTNDDGYGFIAYSDASGKLKAASCTNLICTSKQIFDVDDGGVGEYPSVVRGDNGYVWISYYDAGSGDLKVARCRFTSCDATYVVDADDDAGYHSSITLGPDGHPVIAYVAYVDASTSHIRVARCDRHTSCVAPTVDVVLGTVNTGRPEGIATTRGVDGSPVFTSTLPTVDGVSFDRCKDPECSASTAGIDKVGSSGNAVDVAIAIGSDGMPILAYTSDSDGDVYIAHCSNRSCQPFHREW